MYKYEIVVQNKPHLQGYIGTTSSVNVEYSIAEPHFIIVSEDVKEFLENFANVEVYPNGDRLYIINNLNLKYIGEHGEEEG